MAQMMPVPLTVSCFSKIQTGFTFLVPAHLGSPGKGSLNRCVCMEYKVEGSKPKGRPKRTWIEVVEKDCQACKLNKEEQEDAINRSRWRKLIKDV